MVFFIAGWWWIALIVAFALTGLKVVNEFERGVRFTLGRYSGIMKPGLRLVIPIIQSWQRMDLSKRSPSARRSTIRRPRRGALKCGWRRI